MKSLPAISIVVPCKNAEAHLGATLQSILEQEVDFPIEILVMDGESNDGSKAVFDRISQSSASPFFTWHWHSQKDRNMYEAIERGFSMAEGEILSWLNASDLYQAGSLDLVHRIFHSFPEVHWLKGRTDYLHANGSVEIGETHRYSRRLLHLGFYGFETYFVQQDSCFWRKDLWTLCGGFDGRFRLIGDFQLWRRYASRTPLYTIDFPVSLFRIHHGQLSGDSTAYGEEVKTSGISARCALLKQFFRISIRLPRPMQLVLNSMLSGFDPIFRIEYNNREWTLQKGYAWGRGFLFARNTIRIAR